MLEIPDQIKDTIAKAATKIDEPRIGAVVKAIEDIVGDLDYYSGLSIQVIELFFSKGQL